jgi:hypothetical protein
MNNFTLLNTIHEMIEDYISRRNKQPDRIIIGLYVLRYLSRTNVLAYGSTPPKEPSALFGIPLTVSQDEYRVELL